MPKTPNNPLSAFFGWYGMIAILVAFTGVSFGIIQPHSISYQFLNFTGALGLVWNCYTKKDYPEVTLNLIFAIIAGIVLLSLIF